MLEKQHLNTSSKNQASPSLSFSNQLAELLSKFDINKFKETFEKTKKEYLQDLSNKLSILFSNNSARKKITKPFETTLYKQFSNHKNYYFTKTLTTN